MDEFGGNTYRGDASWWIQVILSLIHIFDCTVETVENYFGIDINYYVRVNFSSVENIVNALGGITVNNPVAFTASDGTYSYEAGDVYMDGAKALRFARERYNLGGGDRDRGKNQMRVITGIINKAISPSIITNYTSILDACLLYTSYRHFNHIYTCG